MAKEPTREERRHNYIERRRHEYLGLITDALVQAKDRTGAELSRWLSMKAQHINKLLGQEFDEFVKPEPIAAPAPSANGTPTNGTPRLTVRA